MTKRLVVIDGKSVFYRGYYAMPSLSAKDGTPTGGVYGFASISLEIIRKLQPDYVAVAWDKKGTNIRKRREIYPAYKAGRKPAPPDFYAQIPILYELLDAFGWPLYELDDYEADDIMGALADQAAAQGIETCLITSDLDALQLIGPKTHVYALKKGVSHIEQFDIPYFEDKYSISVEQFLDLKSLKGDSSDNIPGVPGVGEKTAISLLKEYKTLDAIYDHVDEIKETVRKKLIAGKESAYLSKEVGRIWIDAPIGLDLEATDVHDLDTEKLRTLLLKLEFRTLLKNLPEHMKEGETSRKVSPDQPLREIMAWTPQVSFPSPLAIWFDATTEQFWFGGESGAVYTLECTQLDDRDTQAALKVHLADSSTTVIGHDIKATEKILMRSGIAITNPHHDVAIGAFLLDSLRREQTFESLAPYGVDLTNPAAVIAALWEIYRQQREQLEQAPKLKAVAQEIDFPLVSVLSRMEFKGVKIDTKFFHIMSKQLSEKLADLQQKMYAMVGYEFNTGSPSQLAEVLFTKLQLPTTGIKKGKTGYSTGQKELDKLRGQHPIIELIEQTREIAKLKNTYVDTLPTMVDDQQRLHTTFKQDVAATGRLSSTDPNLQNIPIRSEIGRSIRKGFVADKGNVLVSADYSQFELRLAAVLAGDKQLIEDFNSDIDIHTKTASEVYDIPLDKVTKDQRRDAKVINFGVLYGMSPHGLAAATGMTFTEAKQFIDQYFALRAPIRTFIDATLEKAKTEGYVETFFGRRRPTPDVNSSNFIVRESAKRAAANMPIQGTEADLMKMAMIQLDRRLDGDGVQILQIHDSILVECPRPHADKVSTLMKDVMESVYPPLGIKLRVDVSSGENWGEL